MEVKESAYSTVKTDYPLPSGINVNNLKGGGN